MPARLRLLAAWLSLLPVNPAPAAGPPPRPHLSLGAYHADAVELAGRQAVTPNTRQVVVLVLPGSPADRAGLRKGDVLMRVDGRDVPAAHILWSQLERHRPGDPVTVDVSRGQQALTLRLPLLAIPSREERVDALWPLALAGDPDACFLLGRAYHGPDEEIDPREAYRWYRRAADLGHVPAQCGVGVCHLYGIGTRTDAPEAIRWFRKAAEQGLRSAQGNLAACAAVGFGMPTDFQQAARWWRLAAEQGQEMAMVNLAVCYMEGRGGPADPERALAWLHRAAEAGCAYAEHLIGSAHATGDGARLDLAAAARWFRLAAEKNVPIAQYCLGRCYHRGDGVECLPAEAARWYRRAAEADEPYAQMELAQLHLEGLGVARDVDEARRWLLRIVERDEAPPVGPPMHRLPAHFFMLGDGLRGGGWNRRPDVATASRAMWALGDIAAHRGDRAEASRRYHQAARRGSPEAQYRLAHHYGMGQVVARDEAEAARWLRIAAEQRHPAAQRLLAQVYATGSGVTKDMTEALRWLTRAAELNDGQAQLFLSWSYMKGDGVPADPDSAIGWLCTAAAGEHPQANQAALELEKLARPQGELPPVPGGFADPQGR